MIPDDLVGELEQPPVAAALPRRLGGFPFWRGERPFLDALATRYRAASGRAYDLLSGARTAAHERGGAVTAR